MMKKTLLILISMMMTLYVHAQHRLVVADRVTHGPIPQASIYTKENGQFCSAISNDQGVAVVE